MVLTKCRKKIFWQFMKLRPAQVITAGSLDNAITLLMALGGGTNAVIHLLALAGRLGVPLTLERFDEHRRHGRFSL